MKRIIHDDQQLEHVVNDALGLVATKRSGAVHGDGDGKGRGTGETYRELLVDCKFTEKVKRSVSFTKKIWKEVERMALRNGRTPLLATFTPDTQGRMGTVYVHLTLDDFARLLETIHE